MLIKPKNIADKPGVYLFYNAADQIIYIGKAKSIKDRIASYFNNLDDHKINMIISEAIALETIPVNSELEALYLEADLIKKYQPKFNVLLKEGNPFVYIFFSGNKIPTMTIARTKTKKGTYIGPFLTKKIAHSVYNFLVETFRLKLCKKKIKHGCLQYHIGICAGFCKENFDLQFYKTRLKLAQHLASNQPKQALNDLEHAIKHASEKLEYERAQQLLEYKNNIQEFAKTLQILKSMTTKQKKSDEQHNLAILRLMQQRLFLKHIPYVIDCFDISHLQGSAMVGSCIRYVHGQPEPNSFRRFEIKTIAQQDDYAALREIVQRRYKDKNYPNLIIVDGGKGQISAIKPWIGTAELVGLAKKEETIISADFRHFIQLNPLRAEDALILQIRDKTHNFAVSYHRKKRSRAAIPPEEI